MNHIIRVQKTEDRIALRRTLSAAMARGAGAAIGLFYFHGVGLEGLESQENRPVFCGAMLLFRPSGLIFQEALYLDTCSMHGSTT